MNPLKTTPPHHRIILAVDIEDSSARTNAVKAALRRVMYTLMDECLAVSGVREEYRDPFIDRGDGILVLVHPVDEVPKTLMLSVVVPTLETMLCRHAEKVPDQSLRLRAVLHAGEVHYDSRGCFGESLDVAFRLLNAAEVKERFRRARRPLLLVVSDDIHHAVVRHGYEGIDPHTFEPGPYVNVGGQIRQGWVRVVRTGCLQPAGPPES
jgi:class 3 adenylate cyclase